MIRVRANNHSSLPCAGQCSSSCLARSSTTRADCVFVGGGAAGSSSATDAAGTVDAVVEGSSSSTTGARCSFTSIVLPAVGRLGSLFPVLMRSVSMPHIASFSSTGSFARFGAVRASAFFDRDGWPAKVTPSLRLGARETLDRDGTADAAMHYAMRASPLTPLGDLAALVFSRQPRCWE